MRVCGRACVRVNVYEFEGSNVLRAARHTCNENISQPNANILIIISFIGFGRSNCTIYGCLYYFRLYTTLCKWINFYCTKRIINSKLTVTIRLTRVNETKHSRISLFCNRCLWLNNREIKIVILVAAAAHKVLYISQATPIYRLLMVHNLLKHTIEMWILKKHSVRKTCTHDIVLLPNPFKCVGFRWAGHT